jgi:hypothetical protein
VPLDAAKQDTNVLVTVLAVHDVDEDIEVVVDCESEFVCVGCVSVGFDSGSGVGIRSFPMVIVGKFGKGGKRVDSGKRALLLSTPTSLLKL